MANVMRKVWKFGVAALLGIGVVGLATPGLAHAGGVHLSIGIGVPAPVYVAPAPVVVAPAPVVVQPPPVVTYPSPVVIAEPPPPVVTYPSPVVIAEPPVVYARPFPPGLAERYHGYYPAHGYKYYKHWKYRND